ncbi:MAG: nucleotide sugar dehydrogenase [Alphaproteobacteria bacterium]|nr:nucleotide sugar dehydrogenase [Alphaproteobacteria bacterium]
MPDIPKIAIIGLGYVGLPLAVALARHFPVTGFDADAKRIDELNAGEDRTREIAAKDLKSSSADFTYEASAIAGADIYLITVPTPVDAANLPDLSAVRAACATVGNAMGKGAIVVLESTVYPGVTEEVCGPVLTEASGLECGVDFFLGYSPERINPGDGEHGLKKIVKVVAGQTPEIAGRLAEIYGTVCEAGTFIAHDIRTAEAAKVIENAQRDINIAFVNEVALIFGKLGLSVHEVLEAAGTKWNFLPFTPGLVGGHCIGVDPYYLAHKAREVGYEPEIILAGRRINDAMGTQIARRIHTAIGKSGRVLVLGLTFKENVPDLRNSKIVDLVREMQTLGHEVDVADPLAALDEAEALYGIILRPNLEGASGFDAVIGAVPHEAYRTLDAGALGGLLAPDGLLADIKGMWRGVEMAEGVRRWQL